MPKNQSKKLTVIARAAKRRAVRDAMKRFGNDRAKVAAHFDMSSAGIGMVLARK